MITAQRTDTQLIPVVPVLPPPASDRQDRIRLTPRGRRVRKAACAARDTAGVLAAAVTFYGGLNLLGALGAFQ